MNFNLRLKELRKLHQVTQVQVAETCGMAERAYQRLEASGHKPSHDALIALADYFNVTVDYLLCRGVYEQEDLILAKRDIIVQAVLDYLGEDVFTSILKVADNRAFMDLLSILVKKIEFKEDADEVIIYPNIRGADYHASRDKYIQQSRE